MSYPGGKGASGVHQKIINQMPPHDIYIDGCFGDSYVAQKKKLARLNFGVDLDPAAIAAASENPAIPAEFKLVVDDIVDFLISKTRVINSAESKTLVYLDPPYIRQVRKSQKRMYAREMLTEKEHGRLLKAARKLGCMVMVSHYPCAFYDNQLAGWRRVTFQAQTRGGGMATEALYMNFPEPVELHDYRYLGDDRRERWAIAEMKRRWAARLANMPTLKRYAMLSALEDFRSAGPRADDTGSGDAVYNVTITDGASTALKSEVARSRARRNRGTDDRTEARNR